MGFLNFQFHAAVPLHVRRMTMAVLSFNAKGWSVHTGYELAIAQRSPPLVRMYNLASGQRAATFSLQPTPLAELFQPHGLHDGSMLLTQREEHPYVQQILRDAETLVRRRGRVCARFD